MRLGSNRVRQVSQHPEGCAPARVLLGWDPTPVLGTVGLRQAASLGLGFLTYTTALTIRHTPEAVLRFSEIMRVGCLPQSLARDQGAVAIAVMRCFSFWEA